MAAYVITQLKITDMNEFNKYGAGFMDIFSNYNAKILAVDEEPSIKEGEWPYTRTVILEFDSKESAEQWYHSDAYQEICKHRFAASTGNFAILNGL